MNKFVHPRSFLHTKATVDLRVVRAVLPGPDTETIRLYTFRLTFIDSDPPPCGGPVATWRVDGGRTAYQVALERDPRGEYQWTCTCADASYKAEDQVRVCKHINGLVLHAPILPKPVIRQNQQGVRRP